MLSAVREHFAISARLADLDETRALVADLDARIAVGKGGAQAHLWKANLLRRCGDLHEARASFIAYIRLASDPRRAEDLDPAALSPAGLLSPDGYQIAPVIVIDNFLPLQEMRTLHRHACELEGQFVDARTGADAAMYYPSHRRTLVSPEFTYKRQFFLDFLSNNLMRFQRALGLPFFTVDRVEIKLTNHVEGGFFKPHADNHEPIAAAGRAITWLYYFSQTPATYRGGALTILDTRLGSQDVSPSWFSKISALPNRFVAFPSWYFHAVEPTHVPENSFAAGRFAVSSHVRKTADASALRQR